MGEQIEDPAEETKLLHRCMNDLVSLLALPAIWRGSAPSQIVQTLLDVLVGMLSLDFAYARLNDAFAEIPVEILRVAEYGKVNMPAQELRKMLGDSLAAWAQGSLPQIRSRLGIDSSIFPLPLGVEGEIGMIVLGSDRSDFPGLTESLLLSVATNQASIALQEVRLLNEQKRISRELDRRVAERTSELAQAHAQVARSEERWRSVFENSAVGVALTDLDGRFIATNPVFQKMVGYTENELQQLTFLDITHEEDVEQNRSLVARPARRKAPAISNRKAVSPQGWSTQFGSATTSLSFRARDRVPRFLMALSEDITKRKLSEEALTKARSELAKVASITSLGVLTAVYRTRSQPTSFGNHHECQHLFADALR